MIFFIANDLKLSRLVRHHIKKAINCEKAGDTFEALVNWNKVLANDTTRSLTPYVCNL